EDQASGQIPPTTGNTVKNRRSSSPYPLAKQHGSRGAPDVASARGRALSGARRYKILGSYFHPSTPPTRDFCTGPPSPGGSQQGPLRGRKNTPRIRPKFSERTS